MRINRITRRAVGSFGMLALAAAALSACGSSSPSSTGSTTSSSSTTPTSSSTGTTGSSTSSTTATTGSGKPFLACEVTDTGGINDKSFNQSAYAGLQAAKAVDSNISFKYLPSGSTTDYTPNINQFISQGCGIIVTVGFDMGTATQDAAKAHPSQKFAIVDFNYTPNISNILGLTYDTNQDAFLGGYLAAAMSKTGKVGTFGGQDIPPVTIYMDGFTAGVRYYDKQNSKSVSVLGWNPTAGNRATGNFNGTGTFTNNFTDEGLGETDTKTLLSQGADVIFPVAGAVGLGAAAAVQQANQAGATDLMEWVDVDGCVSASQYCSLFITSVQKGIVTSVKDAVLAAANGTFQGGTYVGTLKNGGVALAAFHDFQSKIPASVQSELQTLTTGIESGTISTDPTTYPAG